MSIILLAKLKKFQPEFIKMREVMGVDESIGFVMLPAYYYCRTFGHGLYYAIISEIMSENIQNSFNYCEFDPSLLMNYGDCWTNIKSTDQRIIVLPKMSQCMYIISFFCENLDVINDMATGVLRGICAHELAHSQESIDLINFNEMLSEMLSVGLWLNEAKADVMGARYGYKDDIIEALEFTIKHIFALCSIDKYPERKQFYDFDKKIKLLRTRIKVIKKYS